MHRITCNAGVGQVRQVRRNGREFIVAPVSMIVPGVLHGSKGALYYPPEEISKNPAVWNGTPVVVNHPTRNGSQISASEASDGHIGVVRKSSAKNGRLRAEAWIDVEKANRVNNSIVETLRRGGRIEISTGLYTDNERAKPGSNYRGRAYEYIARNYRPDHLAILPNQTGACSLQDGCGLNVNSAHPEVIHLGTLRHSLALALGITPRPTGYIELREAIHNAFCPTGEGGGKDNTCSPKSKGKGGSGAGGKFGAGSSPKGLPKTKRPKKPPFVKEPEEPGTFGEGSLGREALISGAEIGLGFVPGGSLIVGGIESARLAGMAIKSAKSGPKNEALGAKIGRMAEELTVPTLLTALSFIPFGKVVAGAKWASKATGVTKAAKATAATKAGKTVIRAGRQVAASRRVVSGRTRSKIARTVKMFGPSAEISAKRVLAQKAGDVVKKISRRLVKK